MYNWQQNDWKLFKFQQEKIEDLLLMFTEKLGLAKGLLQSLSEKSHSESLIDLLVTEAIKNAEIEGEYFSRKDIMSSIKNNLGINTKLELVKDINANGMAALVTEIHKQYELPLTETMLFNWHKMIFPSTNRITVGHWRSHSETMQVISGTIGKEKIHFEAPPSKMIPEEMSAFIKWFNETAPNGKHEIKYAPIRCAIAHLYFETIHPFEDGNGRIGRAIAEKALLQTLRFPLLISLSSAIEADKKAYYQALKEGQKSNEITPWLVYFINTLIQAQNNAELLINFTLQKAKLFDKYKNVLNERQLKVLKRMLKEGPNGFVGGMTAKKYIKITSTSKATATRDMQYLKELEIFVSFGEGRSTSYKINNV